MRLIDVHTLTLESFTNHKPQYAILSHTWIAGQEVTLQLMEAGGPARNELRGWKKIVDCCERAKYDGWHYVWIDTCCIDKTNSVELSEAINSMFSWYEEAVVCYAYLSDIVDRTVIRETTDRLPNWDKQDRKSKHDQRPESDIGRHHDDSEDNILEGSRWFERGWTLQELLAPRTVLFFNRGWELLGTRDSMVDDIARITYIDPAYLASHGAFRVASVATIFSWASTRQTERIEDHSYSLLGLFGIYMPLIYGEGKKAFQRLQSHILQERDDETIFAWHSDTRRIVNKGTGALLAESPLSFNLGGMFEHKPRDNHRGSGVTLANGRLTLRAGLYKRCPQNSRENKSTDSDFLLVTSCYAEAKGQLLFCLYRNPATPNVFLFSRAILWPLPENLPKTPDTTTINSKTLSHFRQVTITKDKSLIYNSRRGNSHRHHKPERPSHWNGSFSSDVDNGLNIIYGLTNGSHGVSKPCGLVIRSTPPSDPSASYLEIDNNVYEPIPPMTIHIASRPIITADPVTFRYTDMILGLYLPRSTIILGQSHIRKPAPENEGKSDPGGHMYGSGEEENTHEFTRGGDNDQDPEHPTVLSADKVNIIRLHIPLPDGRRANHDGEITGIHTLCLTINGRDPVAHLGLYFSPNGFKKGKVDRQADDENIWAIMKQGQIPVSKYALQSKSELPSSQPQSVVHRDRGCRVTVLQWPLGDVPRTSSSTASFQHGMTLRVSVRIEDEDVPLR